MSKAILVMDMPKRCTECAICQHQDEGWLYCTYYHRNAHAFNIPDWCPLIEAPEKYDIDDAMNKPHDRDWTGEFKAGYNACLKDILGDRYAG